MNQIASMGGNGHEKFKIKYMKENEIDLLIQISNIQRMYINITFLVTFKFLILFSNNGILFSFKNDSNE